MPIESEFVLFILKSQFKFMTIEAIANLAFQRKGLHIEKFVG
jgi:hypothetical protein